MTNIAFIPIRGGSKSIPFKNIKNFCRSPLAYWCISAANDAELIDKVYIATDSDIIESRMGWIETDNVKIIRVSKMDDHCMQEQPIIEFTKDNYYDNIVLMQATTPYTKPEHLNEALGMMDYGYDSVVSVTRQHRFLWLKTPYDAYPLNYKPDKRPRRQEWDGLLVENGAFFITTREALMAFECRISGRIGLYEMPSYTYWELDDETDWLIGEEIMKRRVLNG